MKSKTLTIVVKRVGKPARREVIPNNLKSMQAVVGGLIEVVSGFLGEPGAARSVDIVLNEEGRLIGLKPGVRVAPHLTIMGDVYAVAINEDREHISLTDDEVIEARVKLDACDISVPRLVVNPNLN